MDAIVSQAVLERMGEDQGATVGMISLPLPRELAGKITVDHPTAALQPVGWWRRNELPRRSLAFVVDDAGVPDVLRLRAGGRDSDSTDPLPASRWTVGTRVTKEKLDFTPVKYTNVGSLRGVPAENCTTVEFELLLNYSGGARGGSDRTLAIQFGATGPDGHAPPYYWQNVQVDRLWRHACVEAIRVGGVIYNGDTYLWADLYLLLFSNGVAHAAVHFVNTKLHIEGYDFHGLPFVRLACEGLKPLTASLPASGASEFDLSPVRLNLSDAMSLCSEAHPATLHSAEGELFYKPFDRTFNPQLPDAPPTEWPPGFARTVRFQFSLSEAAPRIARYRAPAWWYAAAGEPWPGGFLPVDGAYAPLCPHTIEYIRGKTVTGRFDAASAGFANDGFAGSGLMRAYYHTGRPDALRLAIDYCYYWADIAVDHRDFTVHQWVGGWPWKTCAYSKFRDVLAGYLETGDPYLLDTLESAADAYWSWFRSNWPRCTIGRDSFEVGGWALLRRYLGSERARERTREFARMIATVLDTRGEIGGQMGAGPHPGYLSSLYMTGVALCGLLDVMEAEAEEGHADEAAKLLPAIEMLHARWMRDDVEMFPSSYGKQHRGNWKPANDGTWAVLSGRIYTQLLRLNGVADPMAFALDGLHKLAHSPILPTKEWASTGRPGDNLIYPLYHDALLLGARINSNADGVELAPLPEPDAWPARQTVHTPWGKLQVRKTIDGNRIRLIFVGEIDFPVTVRYAGQAHVATSCGSVELPCKVSGAPFAARE